MDRRADGTVGERVQTCTQSTRAGRGPDQVLENHVPADQERYEFTDGDVTVHVRGTRCVGYPDSKFGVARTWKIKNKKDVFKNLPEIILRSGKCTVLQLFLF